MKIDQIIKLFEKAGRQVEESSIPGYYKVDGAHHYRSMRSLEREAKRIEKQLAKRKKAR